MDSSLLKIFVVVSEKGSISLGAEALGFTQSNVTSRIKQLEKKVGYPLFHRVPKGVKLTFEGNKLLPHAKEIVQKVEIASRQMDALSGKEILHIGTSQANAVMRILPFIEQLTHDFPQMELELVADTTPNITKKLLDYQVDIAFVMGRPKHEELMVLNSFDDELYVVEAKEGTKKNRLIGYRNSSKHFQYLKQYNESIGNRDYGTMIMENYDVLLGCVQLGMGKAFVSGHIIEKFGYKDKLKLSQIPGNDDELKTHLMCRKDYIPKISAYLKTMPLR